MPDRELNARAARSVIRISPPPRPSWARTSKSPSVRPVFVDEIGRELAHQCGMRPQEGLPGAQAAPIRQRVVDEAVQHGAAVSVVEGTCICNQ